MSESERLLALLADVREPAAPLVQFPWLWLLNILLALAWALLWAWRRHRRRTAWRRASIAALDALPHHDASEHLAGMAGVLRRVMRDRLGESVAHLDGDLWLETLDRRFDTHWFSRGQGQVFGSALYRPDAAIGVDIDALQSAVRRRLSRLPAARAIELPDRADVPTGHSPGAPVLETVR